RDAEALLHPQREGAPLQECVDRYGHRLSGAGGGVLCRRPLRVLRGRKETAMPPRGKKGDPPRGTASPAAESELDRRTRELNEAREQQIAISEVLRVIAGSPGELKPVFEAVAERAARICEAQFVAVVVVEGDVMRLGHEHGNLSGLASDERIPIDR